MEPLFLKELIVPALSTDTAYLGMAQRLRYHVENLALHLGRRNVFHYRALREAADLLSATFEGLGYKVVRQPIHILGARFDNLEVRVTGTDPELPPLVIGASYDSARKSPGASSNASGVAALLELARTLRRKVPRRTIRLVAFVNSRFPFANTPWMGSRVYARKLREYDTRIHGMISLDTLSYCPVPESETYDDLPEMIDFLALVGNENSQELLSELRTRFTIGSPEIMAQPYLISRIKGGLWSSDHWSFWNEDYPAVLITGTPPLRYHPPVPETDTPSTLNYEWLASVTEGLISLSRSV